MKNKERKEVDSKKIVHISNRFYFVESCYEIYLFMLIKKRNNFNIGPFL